MLARRHKPRDMGHVDHQIGADFVSDGAQPREVDDARIRAGARQNQFRLVVDGQLFNRVVVQRFRFGIDAVADEIIRRAGEIHLEAMGQMAAVGEAHRQNRVARLQQRHVGRHVRLAAGMRLHVRGLRPEQLAGAVDGRLLDFIHMDAAAVVALARIAFRIFIGKDGTAGRTNGR